MKIPYRLLFGITLLAVGLIITGGVLYEIQSEQSDVCEAAYGTPS